MLTSTTMSTSTGVLLVFGALNAVLYAGLQPLWEGFDESYHYGYVQELSRQHRLPKLGETWLSEEIWQSLELIPVSFRVKVNVRRGVPFDEYWRLTESQRDDLRRRLETIDPRDGAVLSQAANYEAQQAPLAYLLLAPLDSAGSRLPLLARILGLRIWCALLSVVLTALAVLRLTRLLELPELFRLAALFLVFSSQMFFATTAHIANDWLAVPLFTLLLSQCITVQLRPATREVALLGLALCAGLLTKAYFLAMAPLACGVVLAGVLRRRVSWGQAFLFVAVAGAAVPWYVRNLVLYRDLSGMQETVGGTPIQSLASSAVRLPWLKSFWTAAHFGLWTGNSSLLSFHSATISIMLLAMTSAAALYVGGAIRRRPGTPEVVLIMGLFSYAAALAYYAVLTFWQTRGVGTAPSPSYIQLLSPPLLALLMLGLARAGRAGIAVLCTMLWLWTYVITATYVAKLLPFYAGLMQDRARLADVPGWIARLAAGGGGLDTAALLPSRLLLALTAATVALAIGLAAGLSRRAVSGARRAAGGSVT